MLKALWFCLVFLLWGELAAAQTPVLLVVGDSLSAAYGMNPEQGWVNLLKQRLASHEKHVSWQVVNASISGDTSSGGRARLPELLATHQPRVIIVELGGNDGLRGLNLKEMRGNLRAVVEQSQQAGATVILFGIKIPSNYGEAYTQRFEQVFQAVATDAQLAFVPFFLDGVGGHPERMQADGIHPTAAAQGKLLDNVWGVIETTLNAVSVEKP